MTAREYDKSIQYTLAKGNFQRYSEVYVRVVMLVVLFGGLLPFCDRVANSLAGASPSLPYLNGIIFCFGIGLIFSLTRPAG